VPGEYNRTAYTRVSSLLYLLNCPVGRLGSRSLPKQRGHYRLLGVSVESGKRKEAGHYSGLNENRRSKSYFDAIAVESLHTVNHNGASNNTNRIAYPRFLACHQMWVQG